MPGFDATGPMGGGPGTGWGRGFCSTAGARTRAGLSRFFGGVGRGGRPWGGGRGRCFGGGWFGGGWGFRQPMAPTASDEADVLRAELSAARQEIAAMEARLAELEKKG